MRFLADELVLGSAGSRGKCASGQACVQPCECHEQRDAGLLRAGQRQSICARRVTDSILCARRALPRAAGGRTRIFANPGSGEIGESLTKTHSSFETPCGSYAHFKITRYLLRATKDSRYGDSMETRALQLHPRREADQGRRARLLLLRLQQRRLEVLSPLQVALLHRNVFAGHGGLRHQFVFPRRQRRVRESLYVRRV